MQTGSKSRFPKWLVPTALGLLLLTMPFGIAWFVTPHRSAPTPIHDGPFTVHAWYLPGQYWQPHPVGYQDGPEFALRVSKSQGQGQPSFWSNIILLKADGKGGFDVSREFGTPGHQDIVGQVTTGGWSLQHARRKTGQHVAPTDVVSEHCFYRPLTGADEPGADQPEYTYTRIGPDDGQWQIRLDDGTLACIDTGPLADGVVRLQLTQPGQQGKVVQTIPSVCSTGQALLAGTKTIAILQSTKHLWVFDRKAQRLVQRPELAALAQQAVDGVAKPHSFVLSEDCLATWDPGLSDELRKDAGSVKVFSTGGAVHRIPLVFRESADRLKAHPLLRLEYAVNLNPKWDALRLNRNDAMLAPLDLSGWPPHLAIVGPHAIGLVEMDGCRVIVVDYAAPGA